MRFPGRQRRLGTSLYVNTSQGDGDAVGKDDAAVAKKVALRTQSDTSKDPTTGVDLGAGPGAGMISGNDKGGADDTDDDGHGASCRMEVNGMPPPVPAAGG